MTGSTSGTKRLLTAGQEVRAKISPVLLVLFFALPPPSSRLPRPSFLITQTPTEVSSCKLILFSDFWCDTEANGEGAAYCIH